MNCLPGFPEGIRNLTFLILFLLSFAPTSGYSQDGRIDPKTVTIARDRWGTPHIYAKTDAQVAYGLAWATAEDNFFDLQKNLLLANAALGEVDGKQGALYDYAVHLIRAREIVTDRYQEEVSPAFKKHLEAFVQGLNDYAESHPDEILIKRIFPVYPQDILIAYMMSFVLLSGLDGHVLNILEGRPGGPTRHSRRGSNGFVFNSKKTKDGSVFLANNSHQPLDGQTAWYEAHVQSEEGWNCQGGLFPGGVSIFAGCNQNIAWMQTVNGPDMVDVYELEMNPENPNQYKMDGKWLTLEERKIKLKVKVGPVKIGVKRKLYESVHGPAFKTKEGTYAIRYSLTYTIKTAEQWYLMNKANNYAEFRKTLDMQGFPSLNLVYADRYDTIYYLSNGLLPVRQPGYNWRGLLPGNTSDVVWDQIHPVSALPQVLQPPSGYIYNTNHSPLNATEAPYNFPWSKYDTTMGYQEIENNRSIRFRELVDEMETLDYQDFKRVKYDLKYPENPYLFYVSNLDKLYNLSPQKYPEQSAGIEILKNWNRSAHKDSQGAAMMLLTYYHLYNKIKDEGKLYVRREIPESYFIESIDFAQEHLSRHFGTFNVKLGEVQRHVRGKRDEACSGLPDIISAMFSLPWKNGKFKTLLGDSYIQLIRFTNDGVKIESVLPYGTSNHEESPHFDDQMDLFLNQATKEMIFEKEEIMKNAERIYHPGE